MDMDNKMGIITCFVLIIMCACDNTYKLKTKSLYITDSKPCTDSLYEVWNHSYNGRQIELQFVVENSTNKKLYLPLSTWYKKSTDSISVCLTNGKEKIVPYFSVKKVPYDSDIINVNDSMRIFIRICRFPEWQEKWCNANTNIHDIISMLRVSYYSNDSPMKHIEKKAKIEFDKVITKYSLFEIPSGGNIDSF